VSLPAEFGNYGGVVLATDPSNELAEGVGRHGGSRSRCWRRSARLS